MDDVSQYDWLINSTARKFYNVEWEDLYQAGCLGLVKAYNNYNNPDVVFSEYAKKMSLEKCMSYQLKVVI